MLYIKCCVLLLLTILVNVNGEDYSLISIDSLNNYNIKTLKFALTKGFSGLCTALLDDAIIDCFGEGDVNTIKLNLISKDGYKTLPIKNMSQICDIEEYFNKNKHTLIIVTGFLSSETYNIHRKLSEIPQCRTDYNIIHMDIGITIEMLYKVLRFNVKMISYLILKIVHTLMRNNISHKDITLIGFSSACQLVGGAAQLFAEQNHNELLLERIIAIDPSSACYEYDNSLSKNVAKQVIVFHGNNGFYGNKEPQGHIDFYPNGDVQTQPGCKSNICSHMFPLWLLVESICYPKNILAQKCDSWDNFIIGKCFNNQIIGINMNITMDVNGQYYCKTTNRVPFGISKGGVRMVGT